MSNAAAPTAPPGVIHSYGVNGGAQVCCHPAALDSRATTHRLSMPPRTVQTMPAVLVDLTVVQTFEVMRWPLRPTACASSRQQISFVKRPMDSSWSPLVTLSYRRQGWLPVREDLSGWDLRQVRCTLIRRTQSRTAGSRTYPQELLWSDQ